MTVTVRKPPAEALRDLERVVVEGDLQTLTEAERIGYYARVAESLGLNPLTKPFEYIRLNNKLTLYVRKEATDQLRQIHGVSIPNLERVRDDDLGLFTVIAHATDRYGREDSGMGVVSIAGLKGEALANAMMKADTKARRRVTLSIVGLGWMDEIEALDRQAVEVAPRAALAEGIKSRTQTLREIEAASSEAPAADVSPGEEVPASVVSSPAATCDHPADKRVAVPQGLQCSQCGKLLSSYDGEVPENPKPAPRGRRKAAEAKKPGDEGYGTARAHAVANERGLDHDAVHRIANDVFGLKTLSVAEISEEAWPEVIAAILEAPIDDGEAEGFAGRMAQAAGIGEVDNPWPEAEPMAAKMFGVDVDDLTPAQWREFGIRIYARNPLP